MEWRNELNDFLASQVHIWLVVVVGGVIGWHNCHIHPFH